MWHLPALYDAALANDAVHVVQHLTFLVTSVIFWWPVLAPVEGRRISPVGGVLYLIAAATSTSVLGIALTFATAGLYPPYLHPLGDPIVLDFIRNNWGLSPQRDQALGGMIMWVPGGLVYLGAMMGMLARWYSSPDEDDVLMVEEQGPQLISVGTTTRDA